MALRTLLALLALARAAAAGMPTMWAWGLDAARFLPLAAGVGPWVACLLVLTPWASARGARPATSAGDWLARSRAAPLAVALAIAALAWLLPDRLHFVGDFIVRLGAARNAISTASLFPQAMPLDLLLHDQLPRLLSGALSIDPLLAERVVGAIEAALMGALAVAFARALELTGPAALAAAAVVALGGHLGLFTGYGKAFRELCVVVAAVAVFGVQVARSGRGMWPLGLAVVAGLALHRGGPILIVPYATALAVSWRRRSGWRGVASAAVWIPLAAIAVLVPSALSRIRPTDTLHVSPSGSHPLEILGAALAPGHLVEIGNLLLALTPVSLAALAAGAWALIARRQRGATRSPEALVLAALAVPHGIALLFLHPRQGVFRDWDVFAPAAVAIAAFAAWCLSRLLPGTPTSPERPAGRGERRAGLAIGVVVAAAIATTQWLALQHDLSAGLGRVRAYVSEPPPRPDGDRTLAWDYLGTRLGLLDSLDASADAYGQAASITATPRLLYTWARAEAARERYDVSMRALILLTAQADTWAEAWAARAFVAQQLRDTAEARSAATRALALDPNDPMARGVMRDLDRPAGP